MSSGRPLPNHRAGIREVMLDADFTVLPVVSATRINYRPDSITTFQRPDAEGYILRAANDKGVVKFSVHRLVPQYDVVTAVEEDGDLLRQILLALDEKLLDWLRDVTAGNLSNLLPAGFGWDGQMSQSEYTKLRRIRDLFISSSFWSEQDKKWFDTMLTEAVKTSGRFLTTDWEKSLPLIGNEIVIERHEPEASVDVVLFDKDGVRTRERVRRIIGVNAPTVQKYSVPKNIVRVIVIREHCMLDENVAPYGCSVELYERERSN